MFDFSVGDAILLAGTIGGVALGVLQPLLTPVGDRLRAWLESKVPANVASAVEDVVSTVVHGVEQAAKGQGVSGEDKRTEALRLINSILSERGIKADPNHVEMALQQAVYFMSQAQVEAGKVAEEPKPAVGFQAFQGLHPSSN
jgi:hypothetical protein